MLDLIEIIKKNTDQQNHGIRLDYILKPDFFYVFLLSTETG